MKRVAVLGGGPAGAFAAEQLAGSGFDALLFDDKLAWEKPCGGGLTHKAYHRYPFLIDNPWPKRLVSETVLGAPGAGEVSLRLDAPLVIYARLDLNRMLLERAARAGARVEKARVLAMERHAGGWRLRTNRGAVEAEFCLVATGARNPLRDVGTELHAADAMTALGYYVEGERDRIDVYFPRDLEGYIWIFPRCGHLSVGICGKGEPARALRERLDSFMAERGMARGGARFYSHVLPALAAGSWARNRVAGEGWMAVGDAAGLVDPITGEGLYYAIRSGELAARALAGDADWAGAPQRYAAALREDFAAELEFGARLAGRLFRGTFLGSAAPVRMVQFTRRSPRFAEIMRDLFAGRQDYSGLKRRLWRNLAGSLQEIGRGLA
jgi:geranylgeranyl reductase family protein